MIFVIGFLVVVAFMIMLQRAEAKRVAKMPEWQQKAYYEQQRESQARWQHGPRNAAMICPHCQEKGKVHTKQLTQKKGVSGAKATGAILTGGVSLLAPGLSRKEQN